MTVIYRQLLINDITLFTSQPKAKFYDTLFMNLDLGSFPDRRRKNGRMGYSRQALLRSVVVMKCECFEYVSDLWDYLNNNLIIAHYCGFDITRKLPGYHVFERFIKNLNNDELKNIMASQVKRLYELGIVDASFIAIDSTPISANTSQNNPKSFGKDKFKKDNRPKNDKDCRLGVHTASNQLNEKNYEFYWGYKNHIIVDCISGLPLYELTTTADVNDSSVALDMLHETNSVIPIDECTLIADKAYDVKAIYNTVKFVYDGECAIPLNPRNSKNPPSLACGNVICDAGLAMHKDGKDHSGGRLRQKYCCPFKYSSDDCACPCAHNNYFNGKKHRGCTKYVTLPDDYRLSIDRTCVSFKKIYALRTEIERYNARFKQTRQERMWVRSLNAVRNLSSIAHIALLAVAFAAVITQNPDFIRSRKSALRSA